MDVEDHFYCQLGRTIQAWLWVESTLYSIYALLLKGAHSHLVSATFYGIQSVEAKLGLIDSCLALVLSKDSPDWKGWRRLYKKAKDLNKKRNKIVHEPVSTSYRGTAITQIAISPSHSNALAIAKDQTTHSGPTVGSGYTPSDAKLIQEH